MSQSCLEITLESSTPFCSSHLDSHLQLLYINQVKAAQSHILEQLCEISEQNNLLREIKERFQSRAINKDEEMMAEEQETMDMSASRSLFEVAGTGHFQTEWGDDGRGTKRMVSPAQALEVALADIEARCERSTCMVISQLLQQATEKANAASRLQSAMSRLQTQNLILKERLDRQTKLVSILSQKVRNLETQISSKSKVLTQRDHKLTKLQTSLIIKQQMLIRQTKRLKSKTQQLIDKERQLSIERQQVDGTWDQLLVKLQANKEDQFRTQVYSRCKESLLKQRKMLAEEQQALEGEYEGVRRMIGQLEQCRAI